MKKLKVISILALMLAAFMVFAACSNDDSGKSNNKGGAGLEMLEGNFGNKDKEKDTPVGGNDTPVGGNDTPVGGNDTPVGGNDTPAGGNDTPVGGNDTPTPKPDVHEHSFEVQNTVQSTCYEDGWNDYVCTGCKETKTEIIKSEGHKIENDKCTVCNLEAATNLQFTPTLDGTGFEIIGVGSFNDWELIIPSQYQGKPVVSVSGIQARNLSWVYVPASVTEFGDNAFAGNRYLETIIYPDTITRIGKNAFERCLISEFVIPEGVTKIEDGAFAYCSNLKSITIPQSVSEIGEGAFSCCGTLAEIVLPAAVEEIKDNTFESCIALKSVGSIKNIKSFGEDAFYNCENLVFEDMPAGEFTIAEASFAGTGITAIVLPDSIDEIPERAFSGCKQLSQVKFPANLEEIGDSAFFGCEKLGVIDLPATVEYIGRSAFGNTAITELTLSENLKTLESGAFAGCTQLKSVNIPACEEWSGTFENCAALETVILGSGVKNIPYSAFKGLNIQSVTVSEGLETIGESAFENCINLFTFDIPSTIKTIGIKAFYQSGISKVVLPEGLEELGEMAFAECPGLRMVTVNCTDVSWPYIYGSNYQLGVFANCKKLEKVVVGPEVGYIGSFAFVKCEALKEIDFSNAKKLNKIGENSFADCTSLTGTIVIPDTVTYISAGAFLRTGITGVTLPKGITIIENVAFQDTKIKELTLPEGAYTIYSGAFSNILIKELVVPANVKLAGGAFSNCTNLKKVELYSLDNYIDWRNKDGSPFSWAAVETVVIADGITEIPDGFFSSCENLENVSIPASVTRIGNRAFSGCGIEKISIPSGVTEIGEEAFAYNKLEEAVIPGNVKNVWHNAFSNNPIAKLTLEEGVQNLYYGCFSYTQIETVTVPKSVTYIERYIFGYCDKLKTIYCLNSGLSDYYLKSENQAELIYQ